MDGVSYNSFVYSDEMDRSYTNVNNNTLPSTVMNNNIYPNTVMNNNSNQHQPFLMKNTSTHHYPYQTCQEMTNLLSPTQHKITKISGNNPMLSSMDSVYNILRRQVPTFPYEKRLSKIDTLQLTIAYINLLRDILSSSMEPVEYIQQSLKEEDNDDKLEWKTSDLTARLHWVDWGRVGEAVEL
jgi:hypothetical protein